MEPLLEQDLVETCDRLEATVRDLESSNELLYRANRDLTERLRGLTRELATQEIQDPLTGLPNRRGLEKVLTQELGRFRRTGNAPMAALIDCDDFKRVNDRLGHAVGDLVLRDTARRMLASIRPHDCLGRIGGDQFLVLLPGARASEAMQVGERLRLAIADSPLRINDRSVSITASIGVMRVPETAVSIEEIINEAQRALELSKRRGKNRVASQESTDGPQDPAIAVGLADLLLRDGALRVFSQPIHDVSEGRIVGHELLSRGPRGTFESPYDFLRASIENNILTLVDLRCLRNCIDFARRSPGTSGFHLNLLPSTMLDVPKERLLLLFEGIDDPSRVCVEISEQQFIGDPSCLGDHVRRLRESGFRVAIDDVGFGRSSLESLIVLHPDLIKIDRALVHGLARDVAKQRALARLLKVGTCLETEVVAEGVETDEDLEQLRAMGVRYAQGFLWERPSEAVAG